MVLVYSFLGVLVVSLVSLVGILTLIVKEKILNKILILFVSFSAGSLIGGAFFHLLPETLEMSNNIILVFIYLLVGFSLFFALEKILRWHHCHNEDCQDHQHLGGMNLLGDGVHNFLDGMIIFSAFVVGWPLGLVVTLSIILHEIPQEISDFGVLLYSGLSRAKALMYNFISAIISFIGVFLAYFLYLTDKSIENFILPFAAGGFIYIAASDLVPELHKHNKLTNSIISFIIFILALIFMLIIKILFE